MTETCPECGVAAGKKHAANCDVARCTKHGGQFISCSDLDCGMDIWTGEWPGLAACRAFGFWSIGPPWESCAADTPGATEDLNRLYDEAKWNSEKQVWEYNAIESPKVMP